MNTAVALTEKTNHLTVPAAQNQRVILTVEDVAARLGVSVSWVRRHIAELPAMRFGRLLRFDSNLLDAAIRATVRGGKSLEPERTLMVSRYQRGYVYTKGTKTKTWYGVFREDVRTPDGIERRQRKVRLGTMAELPTKNAARNKLAELLDGTGPTTTMVMDMTFKELTERWEKAEGPTLKPTTLGVYVNTLRSGVLPTFGSRKIASITREDIQTSSPSRRRSTAAVPFES